MLGGQRRPGNLVGQYSHLLVLRPGRDHVTIENGVEQVRRIVQWGHDLVLVARRVQVLEALADKLRNVAGVGAQVIAADLSTPEGVSAVSRRLDVGGPDGPHGAAGSAGGPGAASERPVDLLVNNAGFGLGRAFVDNTVANEERGLDVMVRAVMVLSHHAARSMRSRGRGAILNIGSVASRTGGGTYSAHKAWVVAFTEGLSEELAGSGVSATVVCPGPVATSFFANAGIDLGGRLAVATPERVVADALQAVRAGRVQTTPTLTYKAAMAAMKVAPRALVLRAMRFLPHM